MIVNRYGYKLNRATNSFIDLILKSYNATVLYPPMHYFVTYKWTCVHIPVTKWCIVGYIINALKYDLTQLGRIYASVIQAITSTNTESSSIGRMGNNFGEISSKMWIISFNSRVTIIRRGLVNLVDHNMLNAVMNNVGDLSYARQGFVLLRIDFVMRNSIYWWWMISAVTISR